MTSPPGPLVDPDGLQGGRVRHQSRAHESQEGSCTRRQPQPGREPGARVPTEGDTDGLQDRDQPIGFPDIRLDKRWQTLGEDVTLVAAMHRG
jgi:hypothetical protein